MEKIIKNWKIDLIDENDISPDRYLLFKGSVEAKNFIGSYFDWDTSVNEVGIQGIRKPIILSFRRFTNDLTSEEYNYLAEVILPKIEV